MTEVWVVIKETAVDEIVGIYRELKDAKDKDERLGSCRIERYEIL